MSYIGYEYPTDEQLEALEQWDAFQDLPGLLSLIEDLWWMPDWGFKAQKNCRRWELHTGGWSGNEEIISALKKNWKFWGPYWVRSTRGGHYWFDTSMLGEDCQPKVKRQRRQVAA